MEDKLEALRLVIHGYNRALREIVRLVDKNANQGIDMISSQKVLDIVRDMHKDNTEVVDAVLVRDLKDIEDGHNSNT